MGTDVNQQSKPRLLVVLGSTRPGRLGPSVAEWFRAESVNHGGFDVTTADLQEVDLPIFNEPNHPRLGQYVHPHTKRWSSIVRAADVIVFVTPEYNYGFNCATKNAIDYLHAEWVGKCAGFVSYGGASGGLRAVSMLKQVVSAFPMVTVPVSVCIPFFQKLIDPAGEFHPDDYTSATARLMLADLLRWSTATAALR